MNTSDCQRFHPELQQAPPATGWVARLVIGLLMGLGGVLLSASAQPSESLLVTSGVLASNPAGQPRVYIVWGGSDPSATIGRSFAIYQKSGDPSASAPFVRQQIIVPVTSETSAEAVIAQGQALAPDLPLPTAWVDQLLRSAGYPASPTPAAGLASLVKASRSDADVRTNLEAVIGSHPAVALAVGRAWTGPVSPGVQTFELRELDPIGGHDLRPVGRVTLDTTRPAILPAPGAPIQVPDLSASGNLLIRLRWAVSPELRRRSPVQVGFNVWRMPWADASALGLLSRPPSLAELQTRAVRLNDQPIFITRSLSATEASDIVGDRATSFFSDDNRRSQPGGTSFAAGSEFAYFVTSRDLLGRDGLPSGAGLGTACVTLPPAVPSRLEIASLLHTPTAAPPRQALQIAWDGLENADRYEVFRSLDVAVLESRSPAASSLVATIPASGAGGRITWVDDLLATGPVTPATVLYYAVRAVRVTPCGPVVSSLTPPARTAWRNFEPPPPPQGSLEANCPEPIVRYESSFRSALEPGSPAVLTNSAGVTLRRHQVTIQRRDQGIAWVRITATDTSGIVHASPPIWFAADEPSLDVSFVRPLGSASGESLSIQCEVGNASGRTGSTVHSEPATAEIVTTRFLAGEVSPFDLDPADALAAALLERSSPNGSLTCVGLQPTGTPGPDGVLSLLRDRSTPARYLIVDRGVNPNRYVGVFSAGSTPPGATPTLTIRDPQLVDWKPPQSLPSYCAYVLMDPVSHPGDSSNCDHESYASGSDRITGPHLQVRLDSRASEFRLYRRVDEGPLTLIGQGPTTIDPSAPGQTYPVFREDQAMPEAGATICYFAQAVDADGNGSLLSPLGCVVSSGGTLPIPVLARPEPEGDEAQPRMRLTWTCATPGVSRFELFMQPEKATKVAAADPPGERFSITKTVSDPALSIHRTRDPFGKIVQVSVPSDRALTEAIGSPGLGAGPRFSLAAQVEPGVPYTVFVRALSPGPLALARRGPASFSYRFVWTRPTPEIEGDVPWPQRPVPPINSFHPEIRALQVPAHARLWPTNAEDAPVGVRLGRLPVLNRDVTDRSRPAGEFYPLATVPRSITLSQADPNLGLFPELATPVPRPNTWVLPAVLYRQQITNAAHPVVSGDLTQVSPLIGAITWETQDIGNDLQVAWLKDPFILVSRHLIEGDVSGGPPDIWLLDTHPVVIGAKYRYWLVRFQKSGEPDVVIPAGEVEIR